MSAASDPCMHDAGSQQIPQIVESLVHRVFEIGDPRIAVKHTARYADQNDDRLAANCHSGDLDITHRLIPLSSPSAAFMVIAHPLVPSASWPAPSMSRPSSSL